MIVASGSRPRLRANSSLVTTSAPAPSFTPGALPAVVVPSGSNTGRSFDSCSNDVSRLGPSSTKKSPTGTISSRNFPSSIALIAR